MKFAILRREPCFRWLALTLPLVMIATWPMAATASRLRFDQDFAYGDMLHFAFPLLFAWSPAFAFLPLRSKVWSYEEALPVSLLELLRTRIAALCIALAVPVLGIMLVFLVVREGRVVVPVLQITANLLALAGTLALLPFTWSPTSSRVSGFQMGALALVATGLLALLEFSWSGAVYVFLIPVLCWRFQRWTPVVFEREALGGHVARMRPLENWLEELSPLRLVIWRSTFLRPRALGMLVACVASLALMRVNFFLAWMFAFQGPWLLARLGLNVLNGIDALPVSRARLIVPALLPSLFALWAGVWLQRFVDHPSHRWSLLTEDVQLDTVSAQRLGPDGEHANHVVGPASLWRLHTGTEPLIVTAPWGESARLTAHPIFWGAGVSVVNPYDVEPSSSVRFLGWQLMRAVEATTGERFSEEELLAPYSVRRKGEAEVVVADLRAPDLRENGLARMAPPRPEPSEGMLAYLGVTMAWALAVGFALRGGVPPADRLAWRWRFAWRTLGIGSVVALLLACVVVLLEDEVVLATLRSMTERSLGAWLGSSVLGWLALHTALVALVLFLAARRLPRIEVPPAPKVGWGRQAASVF